MQYLQILALSSCVGHGLVALKVVVFFFFFPVFPIVSNVNICYIKVRNVSNLTTLVWSHSSHMSVEQ